MSEKHLGYNKLTTITQSKLKLDDWQYVRLGLPSVNLDKVDTEISELEVTLYKGGWGWTAVGISTEPKITDRSKEYPSVPLNLVYNSFDELGTGPSIGDHLEKGKKVYMKLTGLLEQRKAKVYLCNDGQIKISEL